MLCEKPVGRAGMGQSGPFVRGFLCGRLFPDPAGCKSTAFILRQPDGVPLFNRRKRDETPPIPPSGQTPAGIGERSVEATPGTAPNTPATQDGDRDNGLGVPPYRPAPPKDAPTMSRPPFPQPSVNPAPAPGSAPRPAMPPARPVARDPADRRTLVVGRGISVQGTIQDAERLVVEGLVEATLLQATELSITQGGMFKGAVEVEDAEIAGTIDGTVTARGSLIVRSTGKVLGTARCRRLQVEDGGQITGTIEMMTDAAKAEPPRPVEASD